MNRTWLIVRILLAAAFTFLVVFGSVLLLRERKSGQTEVGQREPLPSLKYCSSDQVRPCVLSFQLDHHGKMIVNILINRDSPPFYLKVRRETGETTYPCQQVTGFITNFSCVGERVPVGEAINFLIVSRKEDTILAAGNFPVIGLAIATPDIFSTPTSIPYFHRPPK